MSHHRLFGRATAVRSALLTVPLLFASPAQAQQPQWKLQNSGTNASFRGMSVVSPDVAWISGTRGTFEWTSDAGRSWNPGHVAGAASFDFRAVHAISLDTAVLLVSAQDTALIYRTTDRGRSWKVVYQNETKGAFLDGMAFFDSRHGLAVGDPMGGRMLILETRDGGEHWARIPDAGLPLALAGEGAFAASGTSLITCGANDAWLGTGGAASSRVYHSSDGGRNWSVVATPVSAGVAAAGIFSLACRDTQHVIAVGGNYSAPDASAVTVATSDDGGATWTAADPSPATAFLSGVAYVNSSVSPEEIIAVGTEGTAYSRDSGRSWTKLDSLSLNVVMTRGNGAVFAAGARGRVAEMHGLPPM